MADVLRCAWCEQAIVLSADEPTFHVVERQVFESAVLVEHQQVVLHDDCKQFWVWDDSDG